MLQASKRLPILHKLFLFCCLFLTKYHSSFFKHITIQLLSGAEDSTSPLSDKEIYTNKLEVGGNWLFTGEIFARICRRGSSGKN